MLKAWLQGLFGRREPRRRLPSEEGIATLPITQRGPSRVVGAEQEAVPGRTSQPLETPAEHALRLGREFYRFRDTDPKKSWLAMRMMEVVQILDHTNIAETIAKAEEEVASTRVNSHLSHNAKRSTIFGISELVEKTISNSDFSDVTTNLGDRALLQETVKHLGGSTPLEQMQGRVELLRALGAPVETEERALVRLREIHDSRKDEGDRFRKTFYAKLARARDRAGNQARAEPSSARVVEAEEASLSDQSLKDLVRELVDIADLGEFHSAVMAGRGLFDTGGCHLRTRRIGKELNTLGGVPLMRRAIESVQMAGGDWASLSLCWSGIGEWKSDPDEGHRENAATIPRVDVPRASFGDSEEPLESSVLRAGKDFMTHSGSPPELVVQTLEKLWTTLDALGGKAIIREVCSRLSDREDLATPLRALLSQCAMRYFEPAEEARLRDEIVMLHGSGGMILLPRGSAAKHGSSSSLWDVQVERCAERVTFAATGRIPLVLDVDPLPEDVAGLYLSYRAAENDAEAAGNGRLCLEMLKVLQVNDGEGRLEYLTRLSKVVPALFTRGGLNGSIDIGAEAASPRASGRMCKGKDSVNHADFMLTCGRVLLSILLAHGRKPAPTALAIRQASYDVTGWTLDELVPQDHTAPEERYADCARDELFNLAARILWSEEGAYHFSNSVPGDLERDLMTVRKIVDALKIP